MKKILFLFLMLFALCSCQQNKSNQFHIDGELPVLTKFEGNINGGRFYEQFTDDFIPSDEYGEIIPFVGRSIVFEIDDDWLEQVNYNTYGFCTPDGKIVMDASEKNTNIYYNQSDDGFGYYTLFQEVGLKADAVDEYDTVNKFIIPKSGKWAMEYDSLSDIRYAKDGFIHIIKRFEDPKEKPVVDLYDYNGNYVKTIEYITEPSGIYTHGLMRVKLDTDKFLNVGFVNEDGEMVLGPYTGASYFNREGLAVISDENYCHYIINTEGKRLTKPYDEIEVVCDKGSLIEDVYDEQIFLARYRGNEKLYDVYSSDGEYIKRIEAEDYLNIAFTDDGDMLYCYTDSNDNNKTIWKHFSDDSDFVSKEFGVMPNVRPRYNNLYVHIDKVKGVGYVFDAKGETKAVLSGMQEFYTSSKDGKYIVYRDGISREQIDARIDTGEDLRDVHFGNTHIYDIQKQRIVYTVPTIANARFIDKDARYIQLNAYNYTNGYSLTSNIWLFDTVEEKIVFENVNEIKDFTIDDKYYLNVSTDVCTTLYDENLNIILRNYHD